MKTCLAFMKKEILGQLRSWKLLVLGIVFILLGVMNAAVAKLTPRLYEMLADTYAESGMTFTPVPVTALDAWTQFFKNIPIGLIVFVLLESSLFTREYRTGTLVLSLTKGLERSKVVIAKSAVLLILWTVLYGLCAGITWGACEALWDNAVAQHLLLAVLCPWVFGLWVIALTVLFSTLARSSTVVLAGTGGVALACYTVSLLPRLGEVLPTRLMDGASLVFGTAQPDAYTVPLIVTAVTMAACFAASFPVFNRKRL